MARRPTIHDVAREAGVSPATVDRVLNAREKVREETARRVYEAARLVGYHAAPLIGQRVQMDLPRLRLGVVLHKERQAFFQTFKAEIERAVTQATGLRASAIVEFAPSQTPADFVTIIERLAERVDAIAASAVRPLTTSLIPDPPPDALFAAAGADVKPHRPLAFRR